MARQKKIQKYVPQTEYPKARQEHRVFQREGVTPEQVIGYIRQFNEYKRQKHGPEAWVAYSNYVTLWDSGELNAANFHHRVPDWKYPRICNHIFHITPQFQQINDQFLAEYDSREDLQEIYKACVNKAWVYDLEDQCVDIDSEAGKQYAERPQSYYMFDSAVRHRGRSMIELARETPYVEGDLVVLRDTAINSDADPLRVNRWTAGYVPGMMTPDKGTKRIGTVISVTGELSQSWRPVKGSKVMKIMWMGMDTDKIVDVEERYVKFYQRPTYKNGMKTRT